MRIREIFLFPFQWEDKYPQHHHIFQTGASGPEIKNNNATKPSVFRDDTGTVYFYLRHSPVGEIVHSEGHHAFHIGGWATICHAMVAIL